MERSLHPVRLYEHRADWFFYFSGYLYNVLGEVLR